MRIIHTFWCAVLLCNTLTPFAACAQKQLVFLKYETVIARFTEGDYFRCVLKNKARKEGHILELTDFSMITSQADTINFISIEKIESKKFRGKKLSGVGGLLFASGLGYIGLDQLNSLYGSTKGDFDGAYITALSISAVGAALLFIKPKYAKVKRGVVMRTVDYRSLYYQ
jgi:hypothetical protein